MVDSATRHDKVTDEEFEEAKRYQVEIAWSPEDDAFVARVPEAPGVMTHGVTRQEAAAQAEDAIITWLTAHRDAGISVPPPANTIRNTPEAPASPEYSAEDIRRVRRKLDVSQHVFATALNVSRGAVRSWEQGLRKPEGAAMRLLHIAEKHPDILIAFNSKGDEMDYDPLQEAQKNASEEIARANQKSFRAAEKTIQDAIPDPAKIAAASLHQQLSKAQTNAIPAKGELDDARFRDMLEDQLTEVIEERQRLPVDVSFLRPRLEPDQHQMAADIRDLQERVKQLEAAMARREPQD